MSLRRSEAAIRFALPWLCLCALLRGATGDAGPQLAAFDDWMNGLLAKWRIPGAALGVSRNGRLVLARGYGISASGEPVRPDTLFPLPGVNGWDDLDFRTAILTPLAISRITQSSGEWQASVVDLLRLSHASEGSRPPILPQAALGKYLPAGFDSQWTIRPEGPSAGVTVVVRFTSYPSDPAFHAEVVAGISQTANAIRQWPATDLFVDGPEIFARDIVNSADYSSGTVSPGEIVVLFPSNAGPAQLAGAQVGSDGRIVTALGDTRVLFDGVPGPMAYTTSGQVAVVAPYEIAGKKSTQVQVEYQGKRSAPVTLPVASSAPAVYTLDATGKGQAAILNSTGCCNSVTNPAVRGSLVSLYATGAGQTVPPGIDGDLSGYDRIADLPRPQLKVAVTVGGKPAEIDFAGAAPHAVAGLLQVNFRVPVDGPTGDAVPVVLSVGDARSADGVTMAIRQDAYRVLVVDGDAVARHRLAQVLKSAGYEVGLAAGPHEALAAAKQHPVDMVICSLALPAVAMQEMVRIIAAERRLLKIVATSQTLGPASLRAADLLGAQAIFPKPTDNAKLLRRVHELLQLHPVPYNVTEDTPALRFPDPRIRR